MSYYDNSGRRPSPGGYNQDPYYNNPGQYNQPQTPGHIPPHSNNNLGYGYSNVQRAPSPSPSPNPTPNYAAPPSAYPSNDYFPPQSNNDPYGHAQPRPSFTSYHSTTGLDEQKFASTTQLNKEWVVGDVVPPLPSPYGNQPYGHYPPPQPQFANVNANAWNPPGTPGSPGGTSHWHAMRNHLLERRVVKQIPLINGNLVMDVPVPKGCVPTSTSGLGAEKGEMDSMRYTAATCDPDEFMRNKFTLRPYLYGRQTELFVSTSSNPTYPDRHDNVQRRRQSPLENPQFSHQKHRPPHDSCPKQDLGYQQLEKGRRVYRCRRA